MGFDGAGGAATFCGSMETGPVPVRIEEIGDEIAILWADGAESYFTKEALRRLCPCAGCGGEPDVTGRVTKPKVVYTEASFVWRGHRVVGGYAMQPAWGDGHNTGLYSWKYLRAVGDGQAGSKA